MNKLLLLCVLLAGCQPEIHYATLPQQEPEETAWDLGRGYARTVRLDEGGWYTDADVQCGPRRIAIPDYVTRDLDRK